MTSPNLEPAHLDAGVLERLEELLAEATPGPWTYETDDEGSGMGWIVSPCEQLFRVLGDSAQQADNAYLASAAVNTLPALLRAIREAARPEPQPSADLPHSDGQPDYVRRLVGMARSQAHPELANVTYPSRGSAQHMRDLVNQLADVLEAVHGD